MLATDLRGLRTQCEEEEKAYRDDLVQLESLRAAVKELDLKPAIEAASKVVEEARERGLKMTQAINEALADLEELGSNPSDFGEYEKEIMELQSSREQFELARDRDEAKAVVAECETKELLEEQSRLEAQISDARAKCKALVDEAALARRQAAEIRALPKPVVPVAKKEPDAIKMRALERRVGLRLLRATMRSWRQLMTALRFRRELTTRLAADLIARWRRFRAASQLAEAAAARSRSKRAIRAWCAFTVESRRFRELENRADDMHNAAKFRRFVRKVLRSWHRVAAAMHRLRKIAEWQRRKLAQAVIEMRQVCNDWPQAFAPTGRQRAICSAAAAEARLRQQRGEAATLLVGCLTRVVLRIAFRTWAIHAKGESRRLARQAAGLDGLRKFRDLRTKCRTLCALAQSNRLRKFVRRWAARMETSRLHYSVARLRWQARQALYKLHANTLSRCRRDMLRRVARVHRRVRLKRRCFAAWFVARLRSKAALALEASASAARLQEAQNLELSRAAEAAMVEERERLSRQMREAELEAEVKRTNDKTSKNLLAIEATRRKIDSTRAAVAAAIVEREGHEDRAAAAHAAAAAAAVAASEAAQKEQRDAQDFIEEQRRVCQQLVAQHSEAIPPEEAARLMRDITNGNFERACRIMAKLNDRLAKRVEKAAKQEVEARAERDRVECEIADLSRQLENARAEAKSRVHRQIDKIRQQYEENARAQIELTQQKSEAHLALRVKNLVKATAISNPSEHLKCSLLDALRAKRDYLKSRREKAADQDETLVVDPADFFSAAQQILDDAEEQDLPPLPPLRESETERDDENVYTEEGEGQDVSRIPLMAAAEPHRKPQTKPAGAAEHRRRRKSRHPPTLESSSSTTVSTQGRVLAGDNPHTMPVTAGRGSRQRHRPRGRPPAAGTRSLL